MLLLTGRGPTRSTWMLRNLPVGGSLSCRVLLVCIPTFEVWQGWHSLHRLRISLRMLYHTKRFEIALSVGLFPACDRPWIVLKMVPVHGVGTIGLGVPVETSHSTRLFWNGTSSIVIDVLWR